MTRVIFVDRVDRAKVDASDDMQEIEAMDSSYPAEIERLMEQKGYVKQRGTGVSVNALATAAGIHVDTVTAILRGGRSSRPKNVEAVATALGISSSALLEAAGSDGGEVYVGPAATRYMSDRERAALTEFLLATLDRQGKAGEGNAQRTPSIGKAGESPANPEPGAPSGVFGAGIQVFEGEAPDDEDDDYGLAAFEGEENIPHRDA